MVKFEDHFWGDKYNGFETLQQNFKLGLNAGKEFAEFLKERSNIEETYSKSLLKLANKCASANLHVGTFEPCWKFLQSSTEKLANVHNQIIQNLNEVSKSIREYGEKQKEKQKQMKDDFTSTNEAVINMQQLSAALFKARELYQQRSQEVEKCRKDLTNLKDIKNAELKFKKSTDDYKQLVDKRETARRNYCEKMTEISKKLQHVEEEHLTQMLEILSKYGESIEQERFLFDQIIDEFGRNMIALTVENLLQQFINLKQTGKDCPVPDDFEEYQLQSKPVDLDAIAVKLKEEKKKRKAEKSAKKAERKKKKEKTTTNGTREEVADENVEKEMELQLDAEGYVIRPADTDSLNSGKLSKDSFTSDSDSEDSDEERQKIKVRIKPVEETDGSSSNLSQEELKKLSATLTLMSPSSRHQKMLHLEDKKFIWGSDSSLNKQVYRSKSNIDLLNLDSHSDTASIHSLPAVNSSFPALNTVSDLVPAIPLGESNTSSPIGSPPNGNNLSDGSGSLSPSSSFDKSVKSHDAIDQSTEVPPPLPAKTRILPNNINLSSSMDDSDSHGDSMVDISVASSLTYSDFCDDKLELASPLDDIFKDDASIKVTQLSALKSIPDDISNKVNKSTVLKPMTTLEALKPPPIEKRSSTFTSIGTGKPVSSNITAVPRPKPGQSLTLPLPGQTRSLSNGSLPAGSPIITANVKSQCVNSSNDSSSSLASSSAISSFSDLLDINFSSTPAVTSILNPGREDIKVGWVKPKEASDRNLASSSSEDLVKDPSAFFVPEKLTVESDANNDEELLLDQDSNLPVVPRRNVVQVPATNNPFAVSAANLSLVDRAIPIAVAFIETVNGVFKGSDDKSCVIRVTGDMTISFPANIISMLSNNPEHPVLAFMVTGTTSLEQIFPNKALVERLGQLSNGEGMHFKFNMAALLTYLKKQAELGTKASYYNIDILKYQVRSHGISSAPLQFSSYWRCDSEQTNLKIDYVYNPSCMSTSVPLNNVSVVVPVDGGVEIMQSKPTAIWSGEHQRCIWKLPTVSSTVDTSGLNALRARFDITRGPSNPAPIAVQFTGEGTTISLLNFELKCTAYKLSLVKKRITTGKYIMEAS